VCACYAQTPTAEADDAKSRASKVSLFFFRFHSAINIPVTFSFVILSDSGRQQLVIISKVSPRARRDDMRPSADGSSTVAKHEADLRPSADGSAVRTSLLAGGG